MRSKNIDVNYSNFIRELDTLQTMYGKEGVIGLANRYLNCEKDSEGYPIPGTGEVVSEELKNKLIGYLKQINSPINYRTYKIVFNRYKNGLIDLNDSKKY